MRGFHRDRWIPRTKGQLRGKCFHLMTSSWIRIQITKIDYAYNSDIQSIPRWCHRRVLWHSYRVQHIVYNITFAQSALLPSHCFWWTKLTLQISLKYARIVTIWSSLSEKMFYGLTDYGHQHNHHEECICGKWTSCKFLKTQFNIIIITFVYGFYEPNAHTHTKKSVTDRRKNGR